MPAILHPGAGLRKFRFSTAQAAPALRPFVAHYWIVSWDLRGEEPYEQHVLPYPAVNVTFTAGRCRVAGVPRGRFSEVLRGEGRVFGVRFHPGGFRPFLGAPVSSITGRFRPVEAVFGPGARGLADAVLAAGDAEAAALLDAFLGDRAPRGHDPAAELVAAAVARSRPSRASPGSTTWPASSGWGCGSCSGPSPSTWVSVPSGSSAATACTRRPPARRPAPRSTSWRSPPSWDTATRPTSPATSPAWSGCRPPGTPRRSEGPGTRKRGERPARRHNDLDSEVAPHT